MVDSKIDIDHESTTPQKLVIMVGEPKTIYIIIDLFIFFMWHSFWLITYTKTPSKSKLSTHLLNLEIIRELFLENRKNSTFIFLKRKIILKRDILYQ